MFHMWPFKSRGSRFIGDIDAIFPSQLGGSDFSLNDSPIKLWLPDKLLNAVDVLCAQYDASRPDVLRALLFEHAFGRVELAHLERRVERSGPDEPMVQYSPPRLMDGETATAREINQRFLGKATQDIKLFLPTALRLELETLAHGARKPLSDYLRGVLARVLLGERFFQQWQRALAEVNDQARAHENA